MNHTRGKFAGYTNIGQHSPNEDRSVSNEAGVEFLTWTKVDAVFILFTVLGCASLFSTDVLNNIGNELLIFVSMFAMLNPYSATLYLAASQTIPDAPGLSYTPAQLSGVGFAVALIFNNRLLLLPIAFEQVMKWGGAFFLIMAVKRVFFEGNFPLTIADLTMAAAAIMIATYYREIASNKWLWMTCLCMGATIAISAFVLNYLGFEAVVSQGIGDIRDRTYVGRTYDGNNINMVAGAAGLLALWLLLGGKFLKTHHVTVVRMYLLISFFLSLSSIIVSKSKGAIISAVVVFAVLILVSTFILSGEKKTIGLSSLQISIFLLIVMVIGALFLPVLGLQDKMQSFFKYEKTREGETGEAWYLAGREEVWGPAYEDFLNSSIILGVKPGQRIQAVRPAHNVFLGIAKDFGLLGLGAFAFFFFSPTLRLYKRHGLVQTFPFIFFLFGIFLVFSYNPFLNYKTFWVFNGGVIGLLGHEQFGKATSMIRRYELQR